MGEIDAIDIEPRHLKMVKSVLARYLYYKDIWAYGSRVKWTASEISDLDCVVFNATDREIANALEAFDESDIPFIVQLLSWEKIPENFKANIQRNYVVLQEKPELEGWKEYILEDVIEKFIDYRGKTPKKTKCGIPLVTAKIVKAGRILEPNEYISAKDYDSWMTRGLPEIDDIVLTTEAPLGEIALIKDKNIALAQRVITLRGDKKFVYNPFLKYHFQTSNGQYKLQSRASGTTVFGIKASVLKKIPVLLPSLPEQKAIASVLSSLDDKIDLLHRQNKTLETMAETLFRQWFVEEAQEDWDEGCLGDIADINPIYQLKKGVTSTYLEMKYLSTSTFNPEGWYKREFTSGMKFKNGDTLLARITPCLENGKTCFVTFLDEEEIGWGSTEYIVMRMKKPFHPYISYIIAKDKDFRDFAISSMSGSSGRQRAQATIIKEYDIKVAPLEIIEKLNSQLVGILPKLKNNAKQIHTLKKLRDTLLPKLMSGEVRVQYNKEPVT